MNSQVETTTGEVLKIKTQPQQSNTLGVAGTILGGTALAGVAINGIGNAMSRYLGNIGANLNAISGAAGLAPVVQAPVMQTYPAPVFAGAPCYPSVCNEGGYVSKEVAALMSRNAQLEAEQNTAKAIKEEHREVYSVISMLSQKVCDLDKLVSVNASRDQDFRREVRDCYVHQPRVHFDHRVIKTVNDPCCEGQDG